MAKKKFVRTETRAEGDLTPDEEARLKVHVAKWVAISRRTDAIERDKIVPAIKGLYRVTKLAEPDVGIAPSPISMAFAYGAAEALDAQKKFTAIQPVIDSILNPIEGKSIEASYAANTKRQYGQAALDFAADWWRVYQGGNMWAGMVCYITAARDILGLRLPSFEPFRWWEDACIHGHFRVMREKFCIVSDFPDMLKVDERERPHNENGPSHRWRDGYSMHHWHGVKVPARWIEDKAALSAKEAITEANVERRRAACEIVGWGRILADLNCSVIDEDHDPMIGTLVECDLPNGDGGDEKARFLKVLCGTGREFALPVPREMKTALQANAWTFSIDEKDFLKPEVRT